MDIKEEIKQKIDIVDLISRYITLKKAGSIYKANCPFHNENTPSFSVSQQLQIFKCFGCGKGGDIFTFLMEIEGIDFKDALIRLGEMANVDVQAKMGNYKTNKNIVSYLSANAQALKFYNYILTQNSLGKVALTYLKEKRGLTITQINELQLGYAPNYWDNLYKFLQKKGFSDKHLVDCGLIKKGANGYYDVFRGRITIPLINERNEIVGFAGRDIVGNDPKYLNTKDTPVFKKSRFLFNLNNSKLEIKRHKTIIVVEGIFDALTPFIKGVKNIVASQGTALANDQIKLIKRYADTVILLFDNDAAGSEATIRGIELAQNSGLMVKIATLPSGFKDPDEAAKESIDIIYKSCDEALNAFDYFFKYAMNKFDITDSYGKSQIANFLKPKISRITDDILKAHYAKKLAELLNVSDTDIILTSGASTPAAPTDKPSISTPQVSQLLIYLLNCDNVNFKKYFKLAQVHKILLLNELNILNEYKSKVILKKILKTDYLENTQYKEIVEFCFMQDLGSFSENSELADKILNDIVKTQINKKIKHKLTKLRGKIKIAENANNTKKLDILQKKASILAKQLSNL